MKRLLTICTFLSLLACNQEQKKGDYTGNEFSRISAALASGWNTWYNPSVLSHVLLPEGFAVHLRLVSHRGDTLKESLIGRDYGSMERVIPGPRSYDGSYTELLVEWQGIRLRVRSAAVDDEFHLLITPEASSPGDALLVDPQMLWDREGEITVTGGKIRTDTPAGIVGLKVTAGGSIDSGPIRCPLNETVAVSSDASLSVDEIEAILKRSRSDLLAGRSLYRETPELYNAMQTVLAWNTIYDPINDRVITPVSRHWSLPSGGWVLFEWDTYFASMMFALDCRELAYANAIAITCEMTDRGFVPNNSQPGIKSLDRSQPPVGALAVREIYRNHREKWFLYEMFDKLLTWNRWWAENRDVEGYLCWGSDPYDWGEAYHRSYRGVGKMQGAKWESGLDNSPMYDDASFDSTIHRMMQADVGLMSLYIADCRSLSEIAGVLGKSEIKQELDERAARYAGKLETLWDEAFGLYLNKDLVTGKFSYRLSPTLFYPLLAKVPDQEKAERMIREHFYHPGEFWGDYIMPSIARSDPAYGDNHYWRGRIWAPMNFLVYLGIRNYDLPDAQRDMAEKSKELLLKSWLEEHAVYENYSAETGRGDDEARNWSDPFYHWGALLGLIGLMEEGQLPPPELPL